MGIFRTTSCVMILLVASACTYAADPAPAPTTQPILKSDQPVTIDGALDEPIWKSAQPIQVNFLFGKVGVADPAPVMIAKFACDEQYLYIGYETFDKNLVGISNGQKQGPEKNQREGCEIDVPGKKVDVVEFFVSFGDPHYMWEIHQNALNQFNDIWVNVPDANDPINKTTMSMYGNIFAPQEFLRDDGAFTVMSAVKMKPKADGKPSTPNDDSDEDTGYTGEIRIPWRALGVPVAWLKPGDPKANIPATWNLAGHTVSLLAVCQDGDRELRYHHSSPTFPGGWFHQGEKQWPVYRFDLSATAQAEKQ